MAYQYSNPYQAAAQVSTPAASRSTFGAAVGAAQGYQVMFGGLPLDVTDKDLRVSVPNSRREPRGSKLNGPRSGGG